MRITLFALISAMLFIMVSCNTNTIVYYTCNGVTVTRIDFDGLTNFYYGKFDGRILPDTPCITAEYYGFNNGMDVDIIFKKDGDVEIMDGGGGFLEKQKECEMDISRYRNDKLKWILEDYRKSECGMFRLSNSIELEKSFPENKNSKVIVRYD